MNEYISTMYICTYRPCAWCFSCVCDKWMAPFQKKFFFELIGDKKNGEWKSNENLSTIRSYLYPSSAYINLGCLKINLTFLSLLDASSFAAPVCNAHFAHATSRVCVVTHKCTYVIYMYIYIKRWWNNMNHIIDWWKGKREYNTNSYLSQADHCNMQGRP